MKDLKESIDISESIINEGLYTDHLVLQVLKNQISIMKALLPDNNYPIICAVCNELNCICNIKEAK